MASQALQSLKQTNQAYYLACLFVPEDKRGAYAALGAFCAELKRIPLLVSEPFPGEIRLQWWRDVVLGERNGEANSHPFAVELLDSVNHHRLPNSVLSTMAEARIFDLYQDPMPDIAALETYCGETEAALIQLGCLILDPTNAAKAAEAAGHAGMAIGLAAILRDFARACRRQQMYLPADILSSLGVSAKMIYSGDETAQAKLVSAAIALGRDHLKAFKRQADHISTDLRPAFLGVALCEPLFRKAEKLGSKALQNEIILPPLLTPFRIAYRAMRGW